MPPAAKADYIKLPDALKANNSNTLRIRRMSCFINCGTYKENLSLPFYITVLLFMAIPLTASAEEYLKSGLAHYKLRQYEQAVTNLDKAISLNPNYGEAYGLLGLIHEQLRHYEQAIADFDQTIAISPQNAEASVESEQ